jgi:hypothetical protein
MLTEGFILVTSLWGMAFNVLCIQELCAYSAIGRSCAHPLGCNVHQGLRYCSNQAFILSVYPLVLGWNVVDRFCWIPRALHSVVANWLAKHGSQLEIIHLGSLNMGTRCIRYSCATLGPSMVFWQGRNFAALEHPWSTMVSMLSCPLLVGKLVMRSMEMY